MLAHQEALNEYEFQSAPLTEARGDLGEVHRWWADICFNPLPSPKRGEICILAVIYESVTRVSIRSPHRSEGRSGNYRPRAGRHASFNPLPSPKRGEILARSSEAPPRPVSIRSPHRSEGRSEAGIDSDVAYEFQSAPLTEARGDPRCFRVLPACLSFNPLPSPKRGEILLACRRLLTTKFQSAPLTEARGDECRALYPGFRDSFNPLPSPKRGEIRLPPTALYDGRFQSAPLTEARGDLFDHLG